MWPGVLLRAVWISIQLVNCVASEMTKSTCDVVRFKQSKSQNGEVLCATAPSPTVTVSMKTRKECSNKCAHNSVTCGAGFNYKYDETRCELFANPPTTLQVQQSCEYYTVCIRTSVPLVYRNSLRYHCRFCVVSFKFYNILSYIYTYMFSRMLQESLADAKESARQQCVYEGP